MISYRFRAADLADMHFAISPLTETVTSLWALRWPERYVLHLPWIRETRALPIDWDRLQALLAPSNGWLPDFVAPRPVSPLPDIADELRRVRNTPPEKMAADFRAVGAEPVDGVADLLEEYWHLAIEPHWYRMRAVLESDMVYRARVLARDGAAALFTGLDPRVEWSADGVLTLYTGAGLDYHREVAGRGFWLVPALFVPQTISPVGPDEPPLIAYRARGIGTLWETCQPCPPGALAELIGYPRATLLAALDGPASTTELARRLGVTPSAISQHLAVLRRNGLVSKARSGRVVLYARTPLADTLIS
ncbi:ArsR/SmtB family transcription factor [Longispora albida]|uniref:ArsR/SmtB family transcription factor n=1 Tax=Longispora albida TaxID=203523 RepID=UPI00035C342F|nr:metalloregulator ArsR/SmtB family transcription factor [Longispora albida]